MADDNASRGTSLKAKSKSHHLRKQAQEVSKASQRDALRRHRALEKEIDRRSRESSSVPLAPSAPTPSTSTHPPLPSSPAPSSSSQPRQAPEVTFIPTAAGLRPEELHPTPTVEIPENLKQWMELAIRQGIAQQLQQLAGPAPRPVAPEAQAPSVRSLSGSAVSHGQVASHRDLPLPLGMEEMETQEPGGPALFGDEEDLDLGSIMGSELFSGADPLEGDMSEDEGLTPDQPAFVGLFKPHLFRSLLFKAKNTSGLTPPALPKPAASGEPLDSIFSQPVVETDVIPVPPIFSDLVSRQLASSGPPPPPNTQDKRFFNLDPQFSLLLDPPSVDEPIVGLASRSTPSDALEALKPEDKRAELALRRAHLSDAWAVRASTAASFFIRSSIKWLQQLKQHVPATNLRAQQDIAKLTAAAEFSADATFQAAKFSTRAISSQVTARRLLWLRHWQADVKNKAKLASAPFSGGKLFGPALDPFLAETRNKRKYLPPLSWRTDPRGASPSFRQGSSRSSSFPPRYYQSPSYRPFDRSDSDRSRRGTSSKQPSRGSGSRPFRRSR